MTEFDSTAAPSGCVLVGVDGSDPSVRALDQAAGEAARRGTVLEILHALPWVEPADVGFGLDTDRERTPEQAAGTVLRLAAARVAERLPELPVALKLSAEPAAAELLRLGRTAALTVIGTRGRGGFAGLLLGSVSLRVAAHTAAPLLVVQGDDPVADRGLRHERVLVGVADEDDVGAARFAFEEAVRLGARLRVLHTWTHPHLYLGEWPVSAQQDVAAQARHEKELARFAVADLMEEFPQVRVRVDTVRGSPARALVEATRAADVVVIGAHRRGGLFHMQLGPVTHAVLHHAHCPVLLLPIAQP